MHTVKYNVSFIHPLSFFLWRNLQK